MSGFLEILKCVLCCVEDHEEDIFVGLGWSSTSNSSEIGSRFISSVKRICDRFQGSRNYTYAPIHSYDPPSSSSALPQSSPKLLSPPSIPAPTRSLTSSSYQSGSLHTPGAFASRPSPLPPSPLTISSKPSPQATTLSTKSSQLPPPPSTSSKSSSHQTAKSSPKPSPIAAQPSTSLSKASNQAPTPTFHPSSTLPIPPTAPSKLPPSLLKPAGSSSEPSPSSPKASPSPSGPSFSSSKQPPSFKPTLSPATPNLISQQKKTLSPLPPSPLTISSKPSPQATALSTKSSQLPPPPSTSSKSSSHQTAKSSPKSSPIAAQPSTSLSKASNQAPTPTFHPSSTLPIPPTAPSKLPPSLLKPAGSSSEPSPSSPKASPSHSGPSFSSSKQPPSFKPTLSPATPNLISQQKKTSYMWVEKGMSPIYAIPKDIESLIKKDIVPEVLEMSLSPSTYKDYFAALLYAEDFYIEKWSKFQLKNITLKLQDADIIKKSSTDDYFGGSFEKDDKIFVEFEIDSAREKRPFLLSRDFVFARPSGAKTEPYQGFVYRVKRSTRVLVEFGEDFLSQHYSTHRYDVSFSFNRVCLKRAHQAIDAASDPLFKSFIFPSGASRKSIPISIPFRFINHQLDVHQSSGVLEILSFKGPPPYLVEGPLCLDKKSKQLSRTGSVIKEAVLQIHRCSSKHRILICAPINRTCDLLTQSLRNGIPESDIFRANAAFRELDGVPIDILLSCPYKKECFTCPSLQELRKFRVILSTFVSSFRLHNEGIEAGHFSHIFLVDASSATEPEAMVALANLAGESTAVIVTGAAGNHSGWVRSNIARENGLMTSYFERLSDRMPYSALNPKFIRQLVDAERESADNCSFASFSYD